MKRDLQFKVSKNGKIGFNWIKLLKKFYFIDLNTRNFWAQNEIIDKGNIIINAAILLEKYKLLKYWIPILLMFHNINIKNMYFMRKLFFLVESTKNTYLLYKK